MKGGRSGGRTVSGRWQGYVWCDMLISETSLKIFSEQFSQFNWDNSRTNTAIMHYRLRPRRPSPLAQWTRPVGAAIVTSSGTLRNQYDAAGALVCARRRNDVIRCNVRLSTCLRMVHYVQIWRHPYNRKYITYRNAAGEGRATSIGIMHKMGEERICSSGDTFAYRQTRTNRNTTELSRSAEIVISS